MKRFALLVAVWVHAAALFADDPIRDITAEAREPDLPASSLPQALASLVRGEIKTISVDADSINGLTAALCDDAERVSVVVHTPSGNWARVWSKQLEPLIGKAKRLPRILAEDLDGDGMSEILVCSNNVQVYAARNDDYVLAWQSAEQTSGVATPQVAAADFNRDGQMDFAIVNYKGKNDSDEIESLLIYCQEPSQPLVFELKYSTTLTDERGYHSTGGMAAGDFNGDGHPEIVVGNDNGSLWLAAFEDDQWSLVKHWLVPAGGAVGPGLCAGNLDADPASELLIGTNGGHIFVCDFDEQFEPRTAATVLAGRLAYGVASGDLDGDGRDEFVLTRGSLGYAGMTEKDVVAEAWQLREGTLRRVWQQPTPYSGRPVVADIDGDGRLDVVKLTSQPPGLEVLEPRW